MTDSTLMIAAFILTSLSSVSAFILGMKKQWRAALVLILVYSAAIMCAAYGILVQKVKTIRTSSTIPTPATAREGIYDLMYPYHDGIDWIGIVQRHVVDLIDPKNKSFQSHPIATVDLLRLTGYTPSTNILTESVYLEVIHGKDPRVEAYDPFKHTREERDDSREK